MLDERGLHRMHVLRRAEPLDGGDVVSLMHDHQRQTGVDPASVDDHRAGTTLAVVATLFGTGEVEMFAQRIEKSCSSVDREITLALPKQARRLLL